MLLPYETYGEANNSFRWEFLTFITLNGAGNISLEIRGVTKIKNKLITTELDF